MKNLFKRYFITLIVGYTLSACLNSNAESVANTYSILLITKNGETKSLYSENDYAAYGALQLLNQLGLFYHVGSIGGFKEESIQYDMIIYPYSELGNINISALKEYVHNGGIAILGGLSKTDDEIGVEVLSFIKARVPEVSAVFTHNNNTLMQGMKNDGLPVLSSSGFHMIKGFKNAESIGSVTHNNITGDGLISTNYGDGAFIVFGMNIFETVGYGMGMPTAKDEQNYMLEHTGWGIEEKYKSFNWETSKSIKEIYRDDITKDTNLNHVNVIWGDEYSALVFKVINQSLEYKAKPMIWKWFWPEDHEFAASIQHDWDSGNEMQARVFRLAEKLWGVKSALYVLTTTRFAPSELMAYYNDGFEIGLHADKDPAEEDMKSKMQLDMDTIISSSNLKREDIKGIAHHYIRFYKSVPLAWEELRFVYDASWYDTDWKSVFFTGTSRPFNIKHGTRILNVLELPSRSSDVVFMRNNGMYAFGTSDLKEAKKRVVKYIDAVKGKYGHASINIHPCNYEKLNSFNLEEEYVSYIKGFGDYQPQNAWFVRPIDVAEWYNMRTSIKMESNSKIINGSHIGYSYTFSGNIENLPLMVQNKIGGKNLKYVEVNGEKSEYDIVNRYGTDFISIKVSISDRCEISVFYQ
jgi:hypothetical protein